MLLSHSGAQGSHVRLVSLREIEPEDYAAWRALASVALEPNPFFEPEFLLPLAAAFPEDDPKLLLVADDQGWSACLPVTMQWAWRRIPVAVLRTWLTRYSYLGTPLVRRDGIEPLFQLLTGTRLIPSGILALEMLSSDGPVWAILHEALSRYRASHIYVDQFERAAMQIGKGGSSLAISGKQQANFRRRRRALEQELGEPLRLEDRTGDPLAVEEFLAMEANGWKGREGTALASRKEDADFMRAACAGLAAAGRLQVLALTGARTVAMQCNLRSGSTLFGFKTCFDESFARYSPGVLILLDLLAELRDSGMMQIDSCSHATNEHLNNIFPDRCSFASIAVASASPIGHTLMRCVSAAEVAKKQIKRMLNSFPSESNPRLPCNSSKERHSGAAEISITPKR